MKLQKTTTSSFSGSETNPRIFSLSLFVHIFFECAYVIFESLQLLVPHGSLFIEKKIAVTVAHVLLHYLQAFGFYINIYAICCIARHYEAVVTSQFALQADLVLMILLAYFTSKVVLHVSLVYFGMLDGLLAINGSVTKQASHVRSVAYVKKKEKTRFSLKNMEPITNDC
ncbi:hypothetical protein ACJX0J_024908, partial [Zea mays]